MEFEMTAEPIESDTSKIMSKSIDDIIKYTILKPKCGQRQKNAYSYHYLCYAMLCYNPL